MRLSSWSRPSHAVWRIGLAAIGFVGCDTIETPGAEHSNSARPAVLTYEEFRASAYQEPDTGVFIVDGDTLVEDEAGLREIYQDYLEDQQSTSADGLGTKRAPLIVNTVGGADDRWAYIRQRSIPYCVSTTFGSNYNAVVSAMHQAAAAWHQVNVYLQHRSDQDGNCNASNNNVIFDVRPVSGQPYLARAFFPNNTRVNRNVLIDASSFGNIAPYTLPGILRHELGHTIGFRHEHTRPESRACFEDNNWRALTGYDAASVMHYPQCNGTNRGDLNLTASDIGGANSLYGPLGEPGVDTVFYVNNYSDLRAAFGNNWTAARDHWLNYGINEGRRGSADFDAAYYLSIHPDLVAAYGANNYAAAYKHWLPYGLNEGRRSSREFDVRYYLNANPDLKAAYGNNYAAALNHWLSEGLYEGRRASADFDVAYYLSTHADLQAAFGATNYPAALDHWIFYGRAEGRRGAP
ncbi:peptidase M10 [Cystobacter fuscus]|uniref:M57 family metalloprotease n=1 Tax=Cystobacter fuscus TaxID=43 RepID=UPI002B31943A|nr:peptidase M10 [Cystobacter fuscus]